MKTLKWAFASTWLLALAFSSHASTTEEWVSKRAQIGSYSIPYQVYLPPGYTPQKSWPVILFLHGAGEKGDDGWAQTKVGLGETLASHPERYPAVVIFPQCPKSGSWDTRLGEETTAPYGGELAMAALDEVMRQFSVDSSRVYLTGVSMGGYGTWKWGSQLASRFAALVPMSGGGKPEEMAPLLKNMPIWNFHGAMDFNVNVNESREMVDAVKAAGNTQIRYTEYDWGFHNIWDRAYSEPELPTWLFSHTLRAQRLRRWR